MRDGGGEGRGAGGRLRDTGEANHSKAGVTRGTTDTKETTSMEMRGRKRVMEDMLARTHDNITGGEVPLGRDRTGGERRRNH